MGFTRGLGTELVKAAGVVAAFALAANFHERLASFGAYAHIPEAIGIVPAYLLILIVTLWVGRLLHRALIVKLLKRESPGSTWERLGGAALGVGRGVLGIGLAALFLQHMPLGLVTDYLGASVYDRSYAGGAVVEGSRAVLERAANILPGHADRSELFPFTS